MGPRPTKCGAFARLHVRDADENKLVFAHVLHTE